MQTSDTRLRQLQTAKELVDELENRTGERADLKIESLRDTLRSASKRLEKDELYEGTLERLMRQVAGLAIGYDHDEIATRAVRLMEEFEEVQEEEDKSEIVADE